MELEFWRFRPLMYNNSLGEPLAHSVKTLLIWIGITRNSARSLGGNIGICLVFWFITSVIAYKVRQTNLIELPKGKHIRRHHTGFERNIVQTS